MDRTQISRIAHTDHPVAAPVSPANVRTLLARLAPATGGRVLDLGCGSGAWLVELLALRPDLSAVGVDLALPPDAADRAAAAGLAERVEWVPGDAAAWSGGVFDAVLCVGASHAFGGLAGTLDALHRHLRPGAMALLGDGIWEQPPSATAQEALDAGPDDFPDLAGFDAAVRRHGFEPGYGHISTLEEWDDYEFSWTGSLVAWALAPDRAPAERDGALHAARTHRDGWLRGYRGQLGFVTVVLHDLRG